MRIYFLIFIFLIFGSFCRGQNLKNEPIKGTVTYVTSQSVYVKFKSTDLISVGDTLSILKNGRMVPSLIVRNKSSISCVCTPVGPEKILLSDEVLFQGRISGPDVTERAGIRQIDSVLTGPALSPVTLEESPGIKRQEPDLSDRDSRYNIRGRISAASYNTLADSESNSRFRYTFLIQGDHAGNSGLSFDGYFTFRHIKGRWDEVKDNINSSLKVYALSLKYDFNESARLLLGRNINPRISSIGASDGLQFEKKFGNVTVGAMVGSRPDHIDYNLNVDLFQFGIYVSHELRNDRIYLQNTLAYIEQRNDFKVDRRFIYFQHSSTLARNLNLFTSLELSLYENIDDTPKNVVDLTNLYASIRYRPFRKLNLSVSYDTRKNIQYYETFKNYIDSLIDRETRQGIRFHASYRINKYIVWGVNTSWRFQKSERNLSKNLNSYLTISQIPGLNIRTTLSANFLQTNYLNSKIFGIRVSKDMVLRKLYGDIHYRWVDYDFLDYEQKTSQNIIGANLSWNIFKGLSLYLNYEIALDEREIQYHQVFTKLIQRF